MTIRNSIAVKSYSPGMGEAVANRTVNRRIFTKEQLAQMTLPLRLNPDDPFFDEWKGAAELSCYDFEISATADHQRGLPGTRIETWDDVSQRVAEGNAALVDGEAYDEPVLYDHMSRGTILMSGRHLQHSDKNLKFRNQEVVTNCATSVMSNVLFYLLLNGAGVGRSYDDLMMLVKWSQAPNVLIAIDSDYGDRKKSKFEWCSEAGAMVELPMVADHFKNIEETRAMIPHGAVVTEYEVGDSRGGWAKAAEQIERMAFEERESEYLILEFSAVRENGKPIRGMQNRPASGPGPLMDALFAVAKVKNLGLDDWEATMHVDHHLAQCVLVGGARRAARMATKHWSDPTIFRFIDFKQRNNFWTSNNSVTIDEDFRTMSSYVVQILRKIEGEDAYNGMSPDELIGAGSEAKTKGLISEFEFHAFHVLIEIADASYHHGTGEPGIINQDKLKADDEGIEDYTDGLFAGSKDFELDPQTLRLTKALALRLTRVRYTMIVNPCGEIALLMLGAYCVIGDVVLFHADSDEDAEQAVRATVRALIRVNTMDSLYGREVRRTNRIGVGFTGIHEWFYDRFGFTWHDVVDEVKSLEMWMMLSRLRRAVTDESFLYAERLGVVVPHTNTTMKPAGTTSKLFGLSEGAHLPSMRWFMRWVQFRSDDPLIAEYRERGYPTRDLMEYKGTTIVGFPTAPSICELGTGDWVVTAGEATPEDQYEFLRLMEKYWIRGVDDDGQELSENYGNQVSYTLKYDPNVVGFNQFLNTLVDGQFSIKCCSVMPQTELTKYEYQPEEVITKAEFDDWMGKIDQGVEDIGVEHIDCENGACPVDFGDRA
jgi:hypothetical protein